MVKREIVTVLSGKRYYKTHWNASLFAHKAAIVELRFQYSWEICSSTENYSVGNQNDQADQSKTKNQQKP